MEEVWVTRLGQCGGPRRARGEPRSVLPDESGSAKTWKLLGFFAKWQNDPRPKNPLVALWLLNLISKLLRLGNFCEKQGSGMRSLLVIQIYYNIDIYNRSVKVAPEDQHNWDMPSDDWVGYNLFARGHLVRLGTTFSLDRWDGNHLFTTHELTARLNWGPAASFAFWTLSLPWSSCIPSLVSCPLWLGLYH